MQKYDLLLILTLNRSVYFTKQRRYLGSVVSWYVPGQAGGYVASYRTVYAVALATIYITISNVLLQHISNT